MYCTRRCRPAILALAVTVAACGGGNPPEDLIQVDGSSTVFPISEAMAEEFGRDYPDFRTPTIGISGTGGGFQKFCRGETDVNNASRPIRPVEIENCEANGVEYIELPVAYDGIAIVVNPSNDWATEITVEELRRLWEPAAQGSVMRWNQIRPSWPDREIHLFGAGVDSGTYDYFTEAIVGEEGASRGDFTSSEDDNVLVQGVSTDELALGFMPLAYVEANRDRLTIVPVDDEDESNTAGPVVPSSETVRNGTYQPLSRPLLIYVSRAAADRPEVQQFIDMFFTRPDLISEVGYIPLPQELYALVAAYFADRRTGTAFAESGSQVGMTVEELLSRQR